MLTEQSTIDKIEVLETGHIQVRRVNRVLKDGRVIAETYHRHVISPSADLSNEDPKVRAVAKAAWCFPPKS